MTRKHCNVAVAATLDAPLTCGRTISFLSRARPRRCSKLVAPHGQLGTSTCLYAADGSLTVISN